jgi:AraC family transcriptional regulator
MSIQLLERQAVTLAYFRHTGPYGPAVAAFWQNTYKPWAQAQGLGPDHARYGIGHDDPSLTPPAQCRYDAATEVPADYNPSGGAAKMLLPGGLYAVLDFTGGVEQVGDAWMALLRGWLPSSGYRLDTRPCFEYYPRGAWRDQATGDFHCQIHIPVVLEPGR